MKKAVIIAFSLLFIIPISSALYKIEYSCEDDFCVEGAKVIFEILLVHYNLSTRYTGIELLDTKNNQTVAINNNLDVTVTPQNNASISIFGFLPENISKIEIMPCFDLMPLNENLEPTGESGKICGSDFFTIDIVRSVRCDYECCSSNDCKENQECVDNFCMDLNCDEDEYFENHQCKDCNIFQKAEEQGCSFNIRLFIKIILAIGIIAVVFGLLYVKMKIPY